MGKIEKKGDHYELDGRRLYSDQVLAWIPPDGGFMAVVLKLRRDGAPELWTINTTLMQEAQTEMRRTGHVPVVDDLLVRMKDDPLTANLEWTR